MAGRIVASTVLIVSLMGPFATGVVGWLQWQGYLDTGLTSDQLTALAFGLFGLLLAYLLLQQLALVAYVIVSSRWPLVSARVVTATINVIEDDSTGTTSTFHEPQVTYEYVVNGRTFVSHDVGGVGFWYPGRDGAETFLAAYASPEGTALRYDPRRPERARLAVSSAQLLREMRNSGYGYTLLPLGRALLVIGVFGIYWMVYELLKS
jgi:hypothetical protein